MSHVSRSVYQKLKEENKRLLKDLYIIAMQPVTFESIQVRAKWKDKFEREQEFNSMLREVAIAYLKEHPEYDITSKKFDSEKLNGQGK